MLASFRSLIREQTMMAAHGDLGRPGAVHMLCCCLLIFLYCSVILHFTNSRCHYQGTNAYKTWN